MAEETQNPNPQTTPATAEPPKPDLSAELESLKSALEQERTERQKLYDLNVGYQERLGQFLAQQQKPTQPADPDPSGVFDDTTARGIDARARKVAEQIAYQMIHRAQLVQEASDPEVQKEAAAEFQLLNQNPAYSEWPQEAKETLAVRNAQLRVAAKRQQQPAAPAQPNQAGRQAVQQTQLPGTSRVEDTPGQPKSEDEWTKEWIAEKRADASYRRFFQGFYGISPDSPEAESHWKGAAKRAFQGTAFGGASGVAIEFLSRGQK
jgi:hypothetical protein